MVSRRMRIGGLASAVAVAGLVNVVQPWENDGAVSTDIGAAAVDLGTDSARAVERVAYRQDVERIGDIVIVSGQPLEPVEGEMGEMWALIDEIWPDQLRDALAQVSIVREESRGLVGVVHPSATGGWILSLDIADLDDRHLIEETIVHELSHLVTLDREIFTFGEVEGCSGAQIDLGCAEAGTVLAEFAERFWPGDVPSPLAADFVNDYAASGAHEDLAETFTAWVLGWPVSGAAIDAKIEMLSADPELDALADELRVRLRALFENEARQPVDIDPTARDGATHTHDD